MKTKLTYWDRSPQESSQSAGDCTLDRYKKEIPYKEGIPFLHPSTLRYLQQSLTWHGVSSQVSHKLKRLTSTAPHKVFLPSNQSKRPRSWHNTAQRAISPQFKQLSYRENTRHEIFFIEHKHGNEVYFVEKMSDKTFFKPSMITAMKIRYTQRK